MTAGIPVRPVLARPLPAPFQLATKPVRSANEPCSPTHSEYHPPLLASTSRLTSHSESKIDDISRKLDRICQVVDTYGPSPTSSETWRSQPSSTARPSPSAPLKTEEVSESELEGEPALAAQAAFATDYIQQTLSRNFVSTEVTSSLKQLYRMVQTGRVKNREPREKLLQPVQVNADIQLPPMPLVMSCIQRLKGMYRTLNALFPH